MSSFDSTDSVRLEVSPLIIERLLLTTALLTALSNRSAFSRSTASSPSRELVERVGDRARTLGLVGGLRASSVSFFLSTLPLGVSGISAT